MLKIVSKITISIVAVLAITSDAFAYEQQDFVVAKPQEVIAQDKEAPAQDNVFDKVASVANNLIGTKYKFGGISPVTGFDCSGFVKYVFSEGAGIKLPSCSRYMRTL